MLHILLANASGDPKLIREAEKRDKSVRWYVPKRARVGDRVLICYTNEPKRFVAEASLLSDPAADVQRPGWYLADVGEIRSFQPAVPISYFKSHEPSWKWPTYPRSYTSIEGRVERRVRDLIVRYESATPSDEDSRVEQERKLRNSGDRFDPQSAEAVIEDLLDGERSSIQAYLRILAFDIGTLSSQQREDRWGISLFATVVRLNVGWVECVILQAGEVRLLVRTKNLPRGVHVVSREYTMAPGCALVALESSRIATLWPRIKDTHAAAIEIAGRRRTHSGIRDAHSPGVVAYVNSQLRLKLQDPSYCQTVAPRRKAIQYWIVRGRPAENDWNALKPGRRQTWYTKHHPAGLRRSDRVFVWSSSPDKRIVGLATIHRANAGEDEGGKALFEIAHLTRKLEGMPALAELKNIPGLQGASFLKSGPATTILVLTQEQGEVLYQLLCQKDPDLSRVWPDIAAAQTDSLPDPEDEYVAKEGGRLLIEHWRIERDRRIIERKKGAVLRAKGCLRCEICDFDFADRFGSRGCGFCEVHHLQPLCELDSGARTRLQDLAIVCPNCHRMLHRQPILTVEQLRAEMQRLAASFNRSQPPIVRAALRKQG